MLRKSVALRSGDDSVVVAKYHVNISENSSCSPQSLRQADNNQASISQHRAKFMGRKKSIIQIRENNVDTRR